MKLKKYFNYSPNGYSAFPGKRFVYPCKKNQVLFIYFLSNTTLPIWFVTTCIIIIYKTWKRWLKYQGREIKIFFPYKLSLSDLQDGFLSAGI